MAETTQTVRRDYHIDASKEVRNLLEFLYLDVKVRSPSEVSSVVVLDLNFILTGIHVYLDLRPDRLEIDSGTYRTDSGTDSIAH